MYFVDITQCLIGNFFEIFHSKTFKIYWIQVLKLSENEIQKQDNATTILEHKPYFYKIRICN